MKEKPRTPFVWCFDCGDLHENGPEGIWCIATWTELKGRTEQEALTDKMERYGEAKYYSELTPYQQIEMFIARGILRRLA